MGDSDRQRLQALHERGLLTAEELQLALQRLTVSSLTTPPATGPPPPDPAEDGTQAAAELASRVLIEARRRRVTTADLVAELGHDVHGVIVTLQHLGLLSITAEGVCNVVVGPANEADRALLLAALNPTGATAPSELIVRTGRPDLALRPVLRDLLLHSRIRLTGDGLIESAIPVPPPPVAPVTQSRPVGELLERLRRDGIVTATQRDLGEQLAARLPQVADGVRNLVSLRDRGRLSGAELQAAIAMLLTDPSTTRPTAVGYQTAQLSPAVPLTLPAMPATVGARRPAEPTEVDVRMAGAFAYLFTWLAGLAVLFRARNREARFHGAQSVLFSLAVWPAGWLIMRFLLPRIAATAPFLALVFLTVGWLTVQGTFIFLAIDAWKLRRRQLPVIGEIAWQWSGKINPTKGDLPAPEGPPPSFWREAGFYLVPTVVALLFLLVTDGWLPPVLVGIAAGAGVLWWALPRHRWAPWLLPVGVIGSFVQLIAFVYTAALLYLTWVLLRLASAL